MDTNLQAKPCILIVGPGPKQVGGVSTFVEILLSSPILNKKYSLARLDTTRSSTDLGLENRFSFINLIYFFRQAFQFIGLRIRLKPRLVHLQVTSGLAFWKSAIFIITGKILGMKTIAHLHGGMFDQYYRKNAPLKKKLIGKVFHYADVVIALSNRWQSFLLEEVRSDLRVKVVGNTIDLMFAQKINNVNMYTKEKEKNILFLGSLGQRKGVYDVLRAAPLVVDKHPEVCFQFAGEEESRGEKQHILHMCKEYQLTDKVRFLGQVTGPAKLMLFKSAMIYLLPSYGENLPFALLEAMAVGLPVIVTPVGAIPEIVKDGQNGFLVQPGDFQGLANRINLLLDNQDLRKAMSKANISKIKAGFLPDVSMKLIEQIYDQLLINK